MSGFKNGRYDLTRTQAGRWHGNDNCCSQREGDFLDRVWRLHLEPAGFERHSHTSSAVLSVSGPGVALRDPTSLLQALRNPPKPRAGRKVETSGGICD
jgi:hypothetical protein